MEDEIKRKEAKVTQLQKQVFDTIAEKERATRDEIAEIMDVSPQKITPPLTALTGAGIVRKDDADGAFLIGTGVEEEDGKIYLLITGEEEESFDDYTPEELASFYGIEGIDHLKKKALKSALKSVPGVGNKAVECIEHVFEADQDVRSEPTELMRALEDCGIKKALLGRIVREVFLVEKLYGDYVKSGEVVIDTRRWSPKRGSHTFIRGDTERRGAKRRVKYGDEGDYDDYPDPEPVRGRSSSSGREQTPLWAENLIDRIERVENKSRYQGRESYQPGNLHRDKPHITEEPLLVKGKPIPDPNDPGKYLMRRVIHDDEGESGTRTKSRFSDEESGEIKSKQFEKMEKQMDEQREEIAALQNILREHETDNKIAGAVAPLIDKIQTLESRRTPSSSTGMPLSDSQFKSQLERDTIEMVTDVAERNVERMIGPLLEGQTALQKFQLLQQVVMMEKMDKVPSGTYLKHLNPQTEEISPDRVKNTLDRLKGK